jgi:hypothetical protein
MGEIQQSFSGFGLGLLPTDVWISHIQFEQIASTHLVNYRTIQILGHGAGCRWPGMKRTQSTSVISDSDGEETDQLKIVRPYQTETKISSANCQNTPPSQICNWIVLEKRSWRSTPEKKTSYYFLTSLGIILNIGNIYACLRSLHYFHSGIINFIYNKLPINLVIKVMLKSKMTRYYTSPLWFAANVSETDCFVH